MIYLDKELVYPSNTVINDAACRPFSGPDSYSPIEDEIFNIVEDYKIRRQQAFSLIKDQTTIMQSLNFRDFDYKKAEKVVFNIEDDGSFISEQDIKKFEGKTVEMIVKYFKQAWDSWQFKQNCGRADGTSDTYGGLQFHDNMEDDLYVLPDDIEVDDEIVEEINEEEVISDVQQLIYYLRLLQEMSSIKGYSAIQTLILIDRYNGNRSSIAAEGLYKINTRGQIVGRYAASANTSKEFINWLNICECIESNPEAKRWSGIIKKFREVCSRLGVKLADEDYSIYTDEYVNKQISTYLASNEEYIETIGRIDKDVYSLLSPDKIFAQRDTVVQYDDSFANKTFTNKVLMRYQIVYDELEALASWQDSILTNKTHSTRARIADLYDAKEAFVEMFMKYLIGKVFNVEDEIKQKDVYVTKYYFNGDSVLWSEYDDRPNEPFTVRATTLINVFGGWPGDPQVRCYVTMSGCLLFHDSARDVCCYVVMEDLVRNNRNAQIKSL